jgi:hypothetical protein
LINAEWRYPKLLMPGWTRLLEGKRCHPVLPGTWLVAGPPQDQDALLARVRDGLRHGDTLVSRRVDRAVWTEAGPWGPEPVPASTDAKAPWMLTLHTEPARFDALQDSLSHLCQALGTGPCRRYSGTLMGFRMDVEAAPLLSFFSHHVAPGDRVLLCRQHSPEKEE